MAIPSPQLPKPPRSCCARNRIVRDSCIVMAPDPNSDRPAPLDKPSWRRLDSATLVPRLGGRKAMKRAVVLGLVAVIGLARWGSAPLAASKPLSIRLGVHTSIMGAGDVI